MPILRGSVASNATEASKGRFRHARSMLNADEGGRRMSMDTIDAICTRELKTIADALKRLRFIGCKFEDLQWILKQMITDLKDEEKEE